MKEIAIQIVNYKTRSYLLSCLRSLVDDLHSLQQSYVIAIVDNNSGDVLDDIPALFPGEDIRIFASTRNRGFGAGHNFLAQKVSAQYRLLLNPDTVLVQKYTVQRLVKMLKSDPHCAVIGPKLIQESGMPQPWDHGALYGLHARCAQFFGRSFWRDEDNLARVAWVSGAVFLIRDDAWCEVGGFDENFFLYKEEEDLCLRLRQKGWCIIYDPRIVVRHIGSVVASKSVHMERSQRYFVRKHYRGLRRVFLEIFSRYVS